MQYHPLLNTPLSLSAISLGCMSFHDLPTGRPIIEHALDLGINCFDTADLYDRGENERIVGEVLKDRRSEVVIATKVGNRWRADGKGWDWMPRKDYILEAVEASLQRLGTDYIDLYQLHGGTINDPLEEVVEVFEALRERGLIRAYGISSIRPNTIRKWTELAPNASSCMTQYSLLDRRPEEATLGHLHSHQQGVLVRGGVAKGLLANKAARQYLAHSEAEIAAIQTGMSSLLQEGESRAGLALRYALQHAATTTVVLGASHPAQLAVVNELVERGELDDERYQTLQRLAPSWQYEQHR